MTPATIDLGAALARHRSVTPDDAGFQTLWSEPAAAIGVGIEPLPFGAVASF